MEDNERFPSFDEEEGLALALAYLKDPSDIPCPKCGPGQVEIVQYLDIVCMEAGAIVPVPPVGDRYAPVFYCQSCRRASAINLSRDEAEKEEE